MKTWRVVDGCWGVQYHMVSYYNTDADDVINHKLRRDNVSIFFFHKTLNILKSYIPRYPSKLPSAGGVRYRDKVHAPWA